MRSSIQIILKLFSFIVYILKTKSEPLNVNPALIREVEALTTAEFVKDHIVNPHNFSYILNPGHKICNSDDVNHKNVYMLIYVHSATANYKRRQSIRETWARRSMFRDIRIVFMMGYTDIKSDNDMLKLENTIYNDIVQENFIDSYKNLTYKGIMAMKWISTYCRNARYILKVDDDIITNIFYLIKHLSTLEKHKLKASNTIMCFKWLTMGVVRKKGSKWFVSHSEFPFSQYGGYCSGSAFLLTGDLPYKMYNASLYVKYFWVDDYYITGLLARATKASYYSLNSLYVIGSSLVEPRFRGRRGDYLVFGHFGHLKDAISKMYNVWEHVLFKQLSADSNLSSQTSKSSFIRDNDFKNLPDLKWPRSIWDEFLYETPKAEWYRIQIDSI